MQCRHCGRLSDALDAYQSLAVQYAPVWPNLHSFALSRALDIHADLAKAKDVEWIRLAIAYLDTCTARDGRLSLSHQDRRVDYISNLVKDLEGAAAKLESSTLSFYFICCH